LNGGWQVATTTLGHERAGAARLYAQMHVQLEDLISDLADHVVDGKPALEDAATLRRLGEVAVRISYLELMCKRSISATLHGGDALGAASLAKSVWAEAAQELASLAFDLLAKDRWADHRLSSRSLTIAGGTTQINKSVTAVRVLGLPRR
jgi:alkylation response protein AidB-like acyl-CoA dehydrogenase